MRSKKAFVISRKVMNVVDCKYESTSFLISFFAPEYARYVAYSEHSRMQTRIYDLASSQPHETETYALVCFVDT